jgi:hypothetical protein
MPNYNIQSGLHFEVLRVLCNVKICNTGAIDLSEKKITYWRVPVWFTQGTDYWVPSDFFFLLILVFPTSQNWKTKSSCYWQHTTCRVTISFQFFFLNSQIFVTFFLLCFRCRSFSVAWADHLGLGFSKSWKPALLLLLRIVAARSLSSLAAVAAMGFLQ